MVRDKVFKFVSNYWSYDVNKLTPTKTLDELGLFGDDKYDFIVEFSKDFNLDITGFPFINYVENEGDTLGIGIFFKKYILRQKNKKIYEISIAKLIKWVDKGSWQEVF